MIERVTVVQFRVNCRCGSGAGCFEVKVWANTAKFTDVIVTRLRKCSDLIRESKVFIKNKTKVASRLGCSERAVLYFTELLFKSNVSKADLINNAQTIVISNQYIIYNYFMTYFHLISLFPLKLNS